MASGTLTVEQAHRQIAGVGRGVDDAKKRRTGNRPEPIEVASDASLFALDPSKFDGGRGVVLLIAANGEGRTELSDALGRHSDVGGMVAGTLSMGLCLAERYRPELVFIDLGVANVQAFDACHVLSSLSTRAQRRCRVIAGTATVTDAVEKPALMAGAANVTLFPFTAGLFESELGRLEERLGPRKTLRRA
jgi:CheY-like chemotaxis protein